MKILFIPLFALISAHSLAQESILGIDYLEITKNEIIAEAMLEMEPALIEYFQAGQWAGSTYENRVYALRGTAIVLSQDVVSVHTYEMITQVAPEVPLKFLQLDESRYPNLRMFGDIARLSKEGEESRRLYKALYGKEWEE